MGHESLFLPIAILFSSFLGSWHCAGMCGPFAALTGSRGQFWQYHLGRLLSYIFLGALAGSFGSVILGSGFETVRMTGASVFALILIGMGLQSLLNLQIRINTHSLAGRFFRASSRQLNRFKISRSSFAIGLLTGLLPCLWLYTYVLAAASAKSAWGGALVMFLFWLGGLPALSAVSSMIRAPLKQAHRQKQRMAGCVLVFAGIYALFSHVFLRGI